MPTEWPSGEAGFPSAQQGVWTGRGVEDFGASLGSDLLGLCDRHVHKYGVHFLGGQRCLPRGKCKCNLGSKGTACACVGSVRRGLPRVCWVSSAQGGGQ